MSRRSTKQRRAARRRNLLVLAALLRSGKARIRLSWSPVVAAMFGGMAGSDG